MAITTLRACAVRIASRWIIAIVTQFGHIRYFAYELRIRKSVATYWSGAIGITISGIASSIAILGSPVLEPISTASPLAALYTFICIVVIAVVTCLIELKAIIAHTGVRNPVTASRQLAPHAACKWFSIVVGWPIIALLTVRFSISGVHKVLLIDVAIATARQRAVGVAVVRVTIVIACFRHPRHRVNELRIVMTIPTHGHRAVQVAFCILLTPTQITVLFNIYVFITALLIGQAVCTALVTGDGIAIIAGLTRITVAISTSLEDLTIGAAPVTWLIVPVIAYFVEVAIFVATKFNWETILAAAIPGDVVAIITFLSGLYNAISAAQ
jgi:hypothetical protein